MELERDRLGEQKKEKREKEKKLQKGKQREINIIKRFQKNNGGCDSPADPFSQVQKYQRVQNLQKSFKTKYMYVQAFCQDF